MGSPSDEWKAIEPLVGQAAASARRLGLSVDELLQPAHKLQLPVVGSAVADLYERYSRDTELQRIVSGRCAVDTIAQYTGHLDLVGSAVHALKYQQDAKTSVLDTVAAVTSNRITDLAAVGSSWQSLRRHAAATGVLHFDDRTVDAARRIAQLSQSIDLGSTLNNWRTPEQSLTNKLLYLHSLDAVQSEATLQAFVQASTVSDLIGGGSGYRSATKLAVAAMVQQEIPAFHTTKEYGALLKAAGLSLPHWPNVRLLTISERRRRLRQRINSAAGSPYAQKAWSVFQRYELTLREIIDESMSARYGEDWAHERLLKCGCKTLYGRWIKRGGNVFDHADFAQYIDIMCDPEHFEDVFAQGFEQPDVLRELLIKAKDLRAAVMHFHGFSKEDLRDVRLTWLAIEAGLLELTGQYDLGDNYAPYLQ